MAEAVRLYAMLAQSAELPRGEKEQCGPRSQLVGVL